MSPNDIEVLIHCVCQPFKVHPRIEAPAVADCLRRFVAAGIVIKDPNAPVSEELYMATDRGRVHLEQLCQIPYPKQVWVREDGTAITERIASGAAGQVIQVGRKST